MAMVRARLRISGIVQGVFYRASTREEARRLGLSGWVRNLPDGDVEALVEGPESAVDELISWCKVGPRGAEVDEVAVERLEYQGDLSGFSIAY